MKKIILIFCLILSLPVFSQNYDDTARVYNFFTINDKVVWRKVYDIDMTSEQIRQYFTNPIISSTLMINWSDNTNNKSGSLYGLVKDVLLDYKSIGYKWGTTPVIFNYPVSYNVIIDIKEKCYRITVTNIYISSMSSRTPTEPVDWYYNAKKRKWRPSLFNSGSAQIFNDIFINYFTIKDIEPNNDDW